MDKVMEYIRVCLTLKDEQQTSINKWEVTIDNEKRLVTCRYVEFHALTLSSAINSFKEKEVKGYKIMKGET